MKHPDRLLACEGSRVMDSIAKFFSPDSCLYLSQDDKSSVPISRTAAKVQTPLLMSMQSRVSQIIISMSIIIILIIIATIRI